MRGAVNLHGARSCKLALTRGHIAYACCWRWQSNTAQGPNGECNNGTSEFTPRAMEHAPRQEPYACPQVLENPRAADGRKVRAPGCLGPPHPAEG
eukprot:2456417-Alexandrium_andersonii.AAC.1